MSIELLITPKVVAVDVPGAGIMNVPFYHVQVQRKLPMFVVVLVNLGYIPANIEPEDMGGATNLSSAVIINNLRELFEKERLMITHKPPYRCCRIHLAKPAQYWIDRESPKFISMNRMRLMAEEIEQNL